MKLASLITLLFLSGILNHWVQAQTIINDKEICLKINAGLDKVYNLKFDEAEAIFKQVKDKYPSHPAYYFLKANTEYWRIMAENSFKERSNNYYEKLKEALHYSQKLYNTNKKDPEAIFFQLATHSALSYYHNLNEDYFKTMNEARKAYAYMKEGFGLKEQFAEFYFTTGLYNYYVVRYPESRPAVKPFMVFFTSGDIEKGLQQLLHASKEGIFTRIEALQYLTGMNLKYENKPEVALMYGQKLVDQYPDNPFFVTRYTEALVMSGHYEKAEKNSFQLRKLENKYFDMAGCIFLGMIHEKHHKNMSKAESYYLQALKVSKQVNNPTTDYKSFAYAGLGRVYHNTGNKSKAIDYYKKALNSAQYLSIKQEAEEYLKQHD
ncbi:tetratricopeptide repeat protein [Cytophagaceae bacterium ABcell3]|nr:tetratricopeptide repeat protein [Cytophagaceae bacterium ABcell3]